MSGFAKGIIGMIGLAMSAVIVLTLVPTQRTTTSAVKTVEGTVRELSSPCCGDIVISLEGDRRTYYVQAALQDGQSFGEWGDRLMEREVRIHVAAFTWSESRPDQQMVPVTRIEVDGTDFFRVGR